MKNTRSRIYDVLFVLVLLGAAYFRLMGLNWDQSQHLHPDERFMTMVSTALEPTKSLSDFFDTANSKMNPNNRGYGFYVYGTLPLFIVRYVADWMTQGAAQAADYVLQHGASGFWGGVMAMLSQTTNWAGYDEITLVGRVFSALADLGSILFLYLIAARLYGRKVALLAGAFSALAVMQIQQAHFYTVDSFANFFMFLATFFAVELMMGQEEIRPEIRGWDSFIRVISSPLVLNTLGFGIALGASVASKLNAAPLALLLPGAFIVRYFREKDRAKTQAAILEAEAALVEVETPSPLEVPAETEQAAPTNEPAAEEILPAPAPVAQRSALSLETAIIFLILGAFFSVLAFRIFQPYAFSGPGFFGIKPNPQWVQNISDQRAQAGGDVDFPPALQWARRPIWFSVYNLAAWGLGWPLGVLAFVGMLYMAWRMLKGEWKLHILLWGWVAFYIAWQCTQWNPTMRYELPVYPLLALFAAWFVVEISSWRVEKLPAFKFQWVSIFLGIVILAGTFAWAYAFTRIYTHDHSRVQATRWIFQNVPGPINIKTQQADGGAYTQPLSMPYGSVMAPNMPYDTQFNAFASGTLTGVTLGHAMDATRSGQQTLNVFFASEPGFAPEKILATATLTADFSAKQDPRGDSYALTFDKPVTLEKDHVYYLRLVPTSMLALSGASPIQESSWDDGLPLRMDGYDAFGGIYKGDLNFEMYWDDNQDKLNRFLGNLDAGDYIFITSNRQWATTTRVPERYPLTTAYYRNLIGCPEDKDVIWCYNVATPGMFQGKLGFELAQTFTSYPTLGPWQFNTQFAEEAFTVYDAPKVLIFKKTAAYSSKVAQDILGKVDLTKVVHITPRQASNYPGDLMLPFDKLAFDRTGGTWSDLFSYDALQNRYPVVGLLIWYLTLGILGLFTWPLVRLLLPGLSDKGYPLSRLTGLLFLAWFAWMIGSLGGEYSRGVIVAGYGLIVVSGVAAFWLKRAEIAAEIREKGKYFLVIEGIFLLFFLIDLGIRLGNPDLWHPGRGGERPMDFSYLNAVIKSSSFPPYDPWYAGGYINYYYWGYVLVGTPIKMIGIVPSIAYNFVLPSLFAMLGLGGFSVAWNLISGLQPRKNPDALSKFSLQLLVGLAAGAGLVLIGNLGTIQLIYHALQKMVVENKIMEAPDVSVFQHLAWAAQGIGKLLSFNGSTLPIGMGEWYWDPSRVMPVGGDLAITEFPLFTFIFSDLHAHMIALPLTVLSVAWAVSTLMVRKLSRWHWLATLAFGGLVIGSLRPTNTWDFPTYLALGAIVTGYAVFRYVDIGEDRRFGLSPWVQRAFLALLAMGVLVACALLFFEPYARWYGLGYSKVEQWKNEKTPLGSYLTQWGLFLFVIVSWMVWETRQWMAQTPVSALAKLKPYEILIELGLALLVALTVALQFILDVKIAWLAFPLAAWALVLMLRPGQPDAKRLVLFMVGTGLVLTIMVEFIVLSGDIGRMNTVFKFYVQVWVLFAISAAAAFGWLLNEIDQWTPAWRNVWSVVGTLLFAGAFLFLFTGGMDKIRDRIASNTPFTFDSMTYMYYSSYWDQSDMTLNEDYLAIRWMQQNVKGSPVIVEANTVEYRWGTRFTIYTGLPGVVGWNWHQRQQRALFPPNWVTDRIDEITRFYSTDQLDEAQAFLQKYSVRYIIVGQLERIYYPLGLEKFEQYDGAAWQKVYQDGRTAIYEVTP